jgi:hypothetical protein
MAQITPNTPFARVKAGFGSKKDLIEKVKGLASDELWLGRLNQDKSWDSISNSKLLRLHALLSDAKQRFGTRDKLVDALVSAEGRGKDADYKKHFASWPLPRLLDALNSAEKRNKKSSKTAPAKAAEEKPAAAKAAGAKKGAVKKGAAAKKGTATAGAKKGAAAGAKKGAVKKGAAKKS